MSEANPNGLENNLLAPSPCPSDEVPPSPLRKLKRKASQFSLKSITEPFSKRPRLGLRKWAASVCREGSRRFSIARQKWKHQTEVEKRDFAAWKAARRRSRPADPLIGKSEKGFGVFSFDRVKHGGEEWWQEGVSKYQAPKWMVFHK